MHTTVLCGVGPFSVGVALYDVLFSFSFLFGTSGSPVWWYTVKWGGRKERHRAQYGQGGKEAFWEWWQERVLYEYLSMEERWLWGHFSKPGSLLLATGHFFYERGECIVIISIETRAAARALLLRLHETADWGALLRWVRITWHILEYIAKCGSSSCLQEASFFACAFLFAKWREKLYQVLRQGIFYAAVKPIVWLAAYRMHFRRTLTHGAADDHNTATWQISHLFRAAKRDG